MHSNLGTLLHCQRGQYGPLGVFELAPETWAIIWEECLDDENTCRLILAQDPNWFNSDWTNDGRRPNPTYSTPRAALEAVNIALRELRERMDEGDATWGRFSAYIALAEYHLTTLQDDEWVPENRTAQEQSIPVEPQTPPEATRAPKGGQFPAEPEETSPVTASQAAAAKKPWAEYAGEPTGINFKPDDELHAKMEWVCHHVPKMSRLRLVRLATEAMCDQLIAKHYRND